MKVLIAEDDAVSRVLLEHILRGAGYDVLAVEDGCKAFKELTADDPPRMALLDWQMPCKDGIEVCRELRRKTRQAYTYVILLSSRESKRDIVEGLGAGADDYVIKPFDPNELKARLGVGERILDLEDRLVEARESMRFRATHDLLTSLWNRGMIVDLLSREILRSHREKKDTAVILCDIDHFKAVNDKFGHADGDAVLREVSKRLHQPVRSYDFVGRYGGEEFLVVLTGCSPSIAARRAEDLRLAICSKPIAISTTSIQLSISAGVALCKDFPEGTADEIIHEADLALYRAKDAGRNCIRMVQPELVQQTPEKKDSTLLPR